MTAHDNEQISTALLVRNPAVTQTTLDQDTFLVEPESGEVFYLDVVTGGLWTLFAEPSTRTEALDAYLAAFPEQAVEQVRDDVTAAIAEMISRRLIVAYR